VPRLLRALRRQTAEQFLTKEPLADATTAASLLGVVDGSGYWSVPQPLLVSKPEGSPCAINQSTSDRYRQWRHQGTSSSPAGSPIGGKFTILLRIPSGPVRPCAMHRLNSNQAIGDNRIQNTMPCVISSKGT
jgi:hypothetical protein